MFETTSPSCVNQLQDQIVSIEVILIQFVGLQEWNKILKHLTVEKTWFKYVFWWLFDLVFFDLSFAEHPLQACDTTYKRLGSLLFNNVGVRWLCTFRLLRFDRLMLYFFTRRHNPFFLWEVFGFDSRGPFLDMAVKWLNSVLVKMFYPWHHSLFGNLLLLLLDNSSHFWVYSFFNSGKEFFILWPQMR